MVDTARWIGAGAAAFAFTLPLAHLLAAWAAGRSPLAAPLLHLASASEAVSALTGRLVWWLALGMVLVQFAVILQRYVFGIGSIAMQEAIIYMHGFLFLLAAGFTLMRDGHVRVDVLYRTASPRRKAAINLLGTYLFLVPFMLLILSAAESFVAQSWRVLEGSKETSGIQGVFLLKSAIPAFAILMLVQGVAEAAKAALSLTGDPLPATEPAGADERPL
ncbi:MAG: TRAP transporter small permease subunit [Alphaproteobacteria bacterium]|nr:TRAP transporter small permease subunit [Alphaproteobacteria bacterium]